MYVPEGLELRLDAAAAKSGVSKAELIRRGITMLLDSLPSGEESGDLPVFNSGKAMTADQMNRDVYDHIKERSERR